MEVTIFPDTVTHSGVGHVRRGHVEGCRNIVVGNSGCRSNLHFHVGREREPQPVMIVSIIGVVTLIHALHLLAFFFLFFFYLYQVKEVQE